MCIGCTKQGVYHYKDDIKQEMVNIVENRDWQSSEMKVLKESLLKEFLN